MNALVIVPDIPDEAPDAVREGIARRRIVATGGTCPCGAVLRLPNRAQRRATDGVFDVTVRHENDCPAVTGTLLAAIADWQATR